MAEQAVAYVTLVPTAKGFQSAIAKELSGVPEIGSKTGLNVGGKFVSGFGSALKGLGIAAVAAAGLGAAATAALAPAINAASNFFAEFEGVNQIFGDAAGSVQSFAASAATNLGVSETAALNAAKQFGIFATAAGLSGEAAGQFSTDLVQAAADLGSFNDVPVEETLAAIQSGLQGQSEPLRRFGIFLDETSVKAYAMEQGLGDVYDSMTNNERTLLRQQSLIEQLGVQAGDFGNYADTYSNAVKTIQASFQDLQTEIGLIFMPLVEGMAVQFKNALTEMQDPTTELGEKWELLKASFQTLADAFQQAFGDIDVAGILGFIVDGVTMVINGFQQLGWIAGQVGDIINKVFTGDFDGAGNAVATFGARYNSFVDGLYAAQDRIVNNRVGERIANNNRELYEAMTGKGKFATGNTLAGAIDEVAKGVVSRSSAAATATKAATKDFTEQVDKQIERYKKDVRAARKDYAKDVESAQEDFAEARAGILERYNESIVSATIRRDKAAAKALKDYNAGVVKINEDTAKKLADIVQQSQDRLRNAFKSVAEVNVGELFASDAVNKNITGLIDSMREKLTKSRQLIAKTGELAAAGYSQEFIEQVTAAGTDVGVEMADAILNSTPEQQAEIKNLFTTIDTEAAHGMDSLAATLYEKNGLATEELKNLYAGVLVEQQEALAAQKASYDESMAEIMVTFNEEMAAAKVTRDEALADAETTLNEALVRASEDFVDNMDTIKDRFNEYVGEFEKESERLAGKIAGLNRAIASSRSAATSKIEVLSTSLTKLTPLAEGGLVTGPTPALVGEAGPEMVIPLDQFQSVAESYGGGKSLNYFAAPNQSIDSEQELFQAMRRAKVVANW